MREAREAWDRERERLREKVSERNTKWTHTTPPLPVCSAGVTGGAAAGSAAVQLLITGGGEKRGRAADISSQVRGWLVRGWLQGGGGCREVVAGEGVAAGRGWLQGGGGW